MKEMLFLILRAVVTGMTSAVILAAAVVFSAMQLAVRTARKLVGVN